MKQILAVIAIVLIGLSGQSQTHQVDLNEFIKDTQKNITNGETLKMTWWIPVEFWKVSLDSDPNVTKSQRDEIVDLLDDFVIFAVVEGKFGPFGGVTYESYEDVKKNLSLIGQNYKTYKPLDDRELDSDVKGLLSVFKPMLKNMIGEMGENMHFFVFKDIVSKKRIADPLVDGEVVLNSMGDEYSWSTPLGALLPPKKCPEDGEPMSGGWKYCPYHGKELEEMTETDDE